MIECRCGRLLVSGIGDNVVGAGRICGSSKGRRNRQAYKVSKQAVLNNVGFNCLQTIIDKVERHCTVPIVSWEESYPPFC